MHADLTQIDVEHVPQELQPAVFVCPGEKFARDGPAKVAGRTPFGSVRNGRKPKLAKE